MIDGRSDSAAVHFRFEERSRLERGAFEGLDFPFLAAVRVRGAVRRVRDCDFDLLGLGPRRGLGTFFCSTSRRLSWELTTVCAMTVSFLSVAFSSSSVSLRIWMTLSWPSATAHEVSVP